MWYTRNRIDDIRELAEQEKYMVIWAGKHQLYCPSQQSYILVYNKEPWKRMLKQNTSGFDVLIVLEH